MKAVVFDQLGEPDQVLSVREVPTPEPGPGQVRVRMIASPVNPSDLLFVRGRYTIRPKPPAVPGFEGVGVVDKVGPGLNLLGWLAKGKRVTVINGEGGNWAEYAVIPAHRARPVPADLADEQVATSFVNPATALALVRRVLRVPRGAWLLQSAAGSELGKMIIRLARADGIKTINVVRRPEAKAELEALGADAVISPAEGPIPEAVRRVVGGGGVAYAIDPVGGATGTGLFESLAPEGRLIVFGSLSEEALRIDPRLMIAGRRVVESFWLGHWMRNQSIPASLRLFRAIAELIRSGVLASTIGGRFPLGSIHLAARQAEAVGRQGKVLLDLAKGAPTD